MGYVKTANGGTTDTYNGSKGKFATYNGKSSNAMTNDELRAAMNATAGLSGEGAKAHDIFAQKLAENEAEGEREDMQEFAMEQIRMANEYAQQGVKSAPMLDTYANNITGIGDSMAQYTSKFNAQADTLTPYITDYNRWANTLWDQGSLQFLRGTGVANQGQGLMNMDGSNDPNSLVGRYESWIRQIDPDRYVAMAAQDVQKSYDNTMAQRIRSLGRMGYDASSTKTAEFQQRMDQALAAALAGAKTRARQQGLSDMGSALTAALEQAKSMISLGTQTETSGANMQLAGAGLRGNAANLETRKAQIYGMAADNEKSRAAVYQTAAGIWAQKAQIYNNAAAAMLGGAQAVVGQQQVDLGYYRANLDYQTSMMQLQMQQRQIDAQKDAAVWGAVGNMLGSGAGIGALALA